MTQREGFPFAACQTPLPLLTERIPTKYTLEKDNTSLKAETVMYRV